MDVLFSYIFGWVYFTTRVCMNKDTIIEKKEGTDSRGIFVYRIFIKYREKSIDKVVIKS